jgi:hypothetical protein
MDERRVRSLSNQRRRRRQREETLAAAAATYLAAVNIGQNKDDLQQESPAADADEQARMHARNSCCRRWLSFTASPPAYRRCEPRTASGGPLVTRVVESRRHRSIKDTVGVLHGIR